MRRKRLAFMPAILQASARVKQSGSDMALLHFVLAALSITVKCLRFWSIPRQVNHLLFRLIRAIRVSDTWHVGAP